jgi:HK97 family phage prohead protease
VKILYRTAKIKERVEGSPNQFRAIAVVYDIVDSYETAFAPGVFTDSLHDRMPTMVWSHQSEEPIGRVVGFEDNADLEDGSKGLVITFELDDPESVPRAKQAFAQLESGTLEDVSVGFMCGEEGIERRKFDRNGKTSKIPTFVKATLIEVSVVLRGAVPGAKLLKSRSYLPDEKMIPASDVEALLKRVVDAMENKQDPAYVLADAISQLQDVEYSLEDAPTEEETEEPPSKHEFSAEDIAHASDILRRL